MNQNTVAARVENGTVILLDDHGLPGARIGNQFATAGVCGDTLIAVKKDGMVEEFKLKGMTASYVNHLGRSYDPISIQVGLNKNFTIQRENGQSDVYVDGRKIRTNGEAKINHTKEDQKTPLSPIASTPEETSPKNTQQSTDWPEIAFSNYSIEVFSKTFRHQPTFGESARYKIQCEWEALFKYPLWESNIGKGLLIVGGIGLFVLWVSHAR